MERHILLTGPPGIGKTTLVKKISESLCKDNFVTGFFTEEVRSMGGIRTGFDVVSLSGKSRGVLAREVGIVGPKVGKYSVDVAGFDKIAIPTISFDEKTYGRRKTFIVIDEIGKMELFSKNFSTSVQKLFENSSNFKILATVPITKGRPVPLVENIKHRPECKLITVTKENRNILDKEILEFLLKET